VGIGYGIAAGITTAALIGAASAAAAPPPPPPPRVVVVKQSSQPAQAAQAPPPQPASGPNLDYLTSSLASLESLMQAGNRAALQGQMPAFKTYYLQERQKFTDMALLQSMDSRMYALEQYLLTPAAPVVQQVAPVSPAPGVTPVAPLTAAPPAAPLPAPQPVYDGAYPSASSGYPGAAGYPVVCPPPYPQDEPQAGAPPLCAPAYSAYPGAYPGLN